MTLVAIAQSIAGGPAISLPVVGMLFAGRANRSVFLRLKMSDTGFTVPGMTEPPCRYDVTVTVATDGGRLPDPGDCARRADLDATSSHRGAHSVICDDPRPVRCRAVAAPVQGNAEGAG
jgi:hypothetical protein